MLSVIWDHFLKKVDVDGEKLHRSLLDALLPNISYRLHSRFDPDKKTFDFITSQRASGLEREREAGNDPDDCPCLRLGAYELFFQLYVHLILGLFEVVPELGPELFVHEAH